VARHGQGYSRFERVSTVSRSSCCSSCRSMTRSRSPASRSRTSRVGHDGCPWPRMSNGSSARHGAPPHRSPSRRSTGYGCDARPQRLSSDFGTRVAFADLGGLRRRGRVTGRSSSGVTGRPSTRRRSSEEAGSRDGSAPASTVRCPPAMVELPAGGRAEVVFLLGEVATREEARGLIARYRTADSMGLCGPSRSAGTCSAQSR